MLSLQKLLKKIVKVFVKINRSSFIPRLLGYLGLLPFIIPTAFLFCDHHHFMVWRNLLISYAAVILSFLGAVYWGVAMIVKEMTLTKRNVMLSCSVIPSIVAWICLLIPQVYGLVVMSVLFVVSFFMDIQLMKSEAKPAWYIPLRFQLTVVVTACLLTAAFLVKPMLINA